MTGVPRSCSPPSPSPLPSCSGYDARTSPDPNVNHNLKDIGQALMRIARGQPADFDGLHFEPFPVSQYQPTDVLQPVDRWPRSQGTVVKSLRPLWSGFSKSASGCFFQIPTRRHRSGLPEDRLPRRPRVAPVAGLCRARQGPGAHITPARLPSPATPPAGPCGAR